MIFLKKINLLFTIFLTGASVLVIEIIATRILSPYYGNTIFTVSSIISTVLTALSLGYYSGGKLADRHPRHDIFYLIIFLGGLSVLLLHFLMLYFLPIIGYSLSITSGSLIFSFLLFFIPCFLLGTLSPFAIKLQEKKFPEIGIGSISGEIFFWSTLGSICGSLLSGFVLIPHFGIEKIILSIATVLIFLGLIPFLQIKTQKKSLKIALPIILGFFLVFLFSIKNKNENVLYEKDGLYEKIKIYDGELNRKPTRFFQQDRANSGGMFLDSDELTFEYTKYYSIYELFKPETKNALIIGGGAYSIPKELLKKSQEISVDVSEIEPSLFELAKKYFGLQNSNRLKNSTLDGRRFLKDTLKNYDLIFSDVYYSLFSIPSHFVTQEFFSLSKEKLSPDGIFIANMIGSLSRQNPSLIMSEMKTFQSVFSNSYFFAVRDPKSLARQNIIFIGWNSNKKIDFSNLEIKDSKNEIIRNLENKIINPERFNLESYPILTDNFSPTEYLTSKFLEEDFNDSEINGSEMMNVISEQLKFGPRYLSAEGHKKVQDFIISEMETLTKNLKIQSWERTSQEGKIYNLKNIIGSFEPEKENRIILATHYDSKRFANKDVRNPQNPVPGANDSASGVSVLIEIARVLNFTDKKPDFGIDFVFFDGEEGEENYSKWIPLGSTYFSENLKEIYGDKKPREAIVLDMICDKDLEIFKEKSSSENAYFQIENFWDLADKRIFKNKESREIQDDHTPLNKAGIPSFLIIDFNYSYFHTTQDLLNKCNPKSLKSVANSVLNYINSI